MDQLKDFQSLIFSSSIDTQLIRAKINELKKSFSQQMIDHQLILSFSLNYERIPILSSFLSKCEIKETEFIHYDQELFFHLLKNNISFPISIIVKKNHIIEQDLYEELKKRNDVKIQIREKTKIEEIIDKDVIDSFRLISNETNFDFNGRIKKVNDLYKYVEIPIILYCIQKNAMKCFKYALINGADPSHKSFSKKDFFLEKGKWDGYGFAGAIGNIQIIKLIEDQGIPINENLMKGCSKFHQNHIIQWCEKENKSLLEEGLKECIKYSNYEGFDIINKNIQINVLASGNSNNTLLHIAAISNSKEIGEILLSKGTDINAIGIIYQIIKISFLIKRI